MDRPAVPHPVSKNAKSNRWSFVLLVILLVIIFNCFFFGPIGGLARVVFLSPSKSYQYESNLVDFIDHISSGEQIVVVHKPRERPYVYRVEYSQDETLLLMERDYENLLILIEQATPDYKIVFRDNIVGPYYFYIVEFSNGVRATFDFADVGTRFISLNTLEVKLPSHKRHTNSCSRMFDSECPNNKKTRIIHLEDNHEDCRPNCIELNPD